MGPPARAGSSASGAGPAWRETASVGGDSAANLSRSHGRLYEPANDDDDSGTGATGGSLYELGE